MRGILSVTILLAISQISPVSGQSPVNPVLYTIPGSQYTQGFDGLPASGTFSLTGKGPINLNSAPINGSSIDGWQILMIPGSNSNASFAVGTGSSTGNGVYSLGSSGSAERALGSLASSTGIYAMGLVLTNQTGGALNNFTVSFTAEQWRKGGSGNKNIWSFHYKTGVIANIDQAGLLDETNLNFNSVITTSSAASLNGNLPENQQTVSYTVRGINWKAGEQLLLRWDDADETGSDDAVGIDNFIFSASLTSAAPTVSNETATAITINSAELNGSVNDNYATTSVLFEYDTVNTFSTAASVHATPDTLRTGLGTTSVSATITGLLSGVTYYYRISSHNINGTVKGAIQNFTTAVSPPTVTTSAVFSVGTSTAVIGGNVMTQGGAAVTERGVVWSSTVNPTISNTKIIIGNGTGIFSQLITGLPQGTVLYARAYAINSGGIVYGDTIRLVTQTTINSFNTITTGKTNAAVVIYKITTAQNITGLTTANFSLLANGITGASIIGITGSGNTYSITVTTGTGDGTLALSFINDAGLSIPINNKPFNSNYYLIDKTPPQINMVLIPGKTMKIGDTVSANIFVRPDADVYKMLSGNIDGFVLSNFTKKNDSSYACAFIISNGGNDVDAFSDIPVSISLSDSAGNISLYQVPVSQSNDAIDANKPLIISIQDPVKGLFKAGDTLNFVVRFSEKIIVSNTGIPSVSLTVGAKTKTASYQYGSGSDSLLFRYIITAGDIDTDGIKTASTITLNNATIKDVAGNIASVSFSNTLMPKDILIDAIAPVINTVIIPAPALYKAGDTLNFVFGFSKTVMVKIKPDTPFVKLSIGSVQKNIFYVSGSGSSNLLFSYIIQPGDVDKNGIAISSPISFTNSSITDSAGNAAIVSFKTPSSISSIKIDAVAPVFTTINTETVYLCENNSSLLISNAFSVSDDEAGELVSWKIRSGGILGSISTLTAIATSNGKNIIPAGIEYKPFTNQHGSDTIITEITDGIYTSQKMIVVVIQPAIQNNIISSSQMICTDQTPAAFFCSAPSGSNGSYKFIWESATSIDSLHFITAPGANAIQQYVPSSLNTTTWFRRRILSGTCADTSSSIKITVIKNGLWTGNNNADWQNANNWCNNFLPNNATDVFITANTLYAPLIKDTAWCHHLTISNAHLKINGIMEVYGNINSTLNSIDAKNGTVVLTGSSPQNIAGSFFEDGSLQNFIINNHTGVFISDDLNITGTLLLNNGSLQTNDHLTLKQNASIGASATGTFISGNISMEHFIKGGRRAFYLLGHPFTNSIGLSMIKDSVDITGSGGSADGFFTTATNQPSAFFHDAVTGNDSSGVDAGWAAFTNTNGQNNNAWKRYQGIRMLVRGRPGQGLNGTPAGDGKNGTYLPQPVTIKLSGNTNTGDQEISLIKDKYAGYNVVANPYASPIDLSRITKGNDVGNNYWIWNPLQGKNGGYTSFPFRSKNIIQPFNAFIAKANGTANNKLLFTENCKSTDAFSDTTTAVDLDDIFYVELRLTSDSIFWDRLILFEMDSAKIFFDKNDAEKFINSDVNFYSLSKEQKMLSIDARPVTNGSTIPLGLQTNEPRVFSINVAKNKLPLSNTLLLHDIYLNKWMQLAQDSCYIFSTTDDTMSFGNNRFEISSFKKTDTVLNRSTLIVKVDPVPAKDKITVNFTAAETGNTSIQLFDLSGKPVKTIPVGMQKQGQVIIPVGGLLKGIYFVEVKCGKASSTQKMIKG